MDIAFLIQIKETLSVSLGLFIRPAMEEAVEPGTEPGSQFCVSVSEQKLPSPHAAVL